MIIARNHPSKGAPVSVVSQTIADLTPQHSVGRGVLCDQDNHPLASRPQSYLSARYTQHLYTLMEVNTYGFELTMHFEYSFVRSPGPDLTSNCACSQSSTRRACVLIKRPLTKERVMIAGFHPVVQSLLGTLLTWGLTAAGAALVFIFQGGAKVRD